tara:strand:+ start:89 stop:265 length:177 start_codon:yes stop_codon:yes gene_type:complete
MEDFIKDALPKEVIEVQEAIAPPEPEGIGVGGCIGIGIGVVVLAAVFAKLYKCTCKKS